MSDAFLFCSRRSVRRRIYGYTGATFAKYLLSVLIGSTVGAIAFGMEAGTTAVLTQKLRWLDRVNAEGLALGFAVICGGSLAMALVAGLLVQFVSPAASGGAVPFTTPATHPPSIHPAHPISPFPFPISHPAYAPLRPDRKPGRLCVRPQSPTTAALLIAMPHLHRHPPA